MSTGMIHSSDVSSYLQKHNPDKYVSVFIHFMQNIGYVLRCIGKQEMQALHYSQAYLYYLK